MMISGMLCGAGTTILGAIWAMDDACDECGQGLYRWVTGTSGSAQKSQEVGQEVLYRYGDSLVTLRELVQAKDDFLRDVQRYITATSADFDSNDEIADKLACIASKLTEGEVEKILNLPSENSRSESYKEHFRPLLVGLANVHRAKNYPEYELTPSECDTPRARSSKMLRVQWAPAVQEPKKLKVTRSFWDLLGRGSGYVSGAEGRTHLS